MAEASAERKETNRINSSVSLEGLDEGSPQYKHTKRLIQEEKRRKKSSVVVEQWIEVHVDHRHTKGGKVRLFKKMNNGNTHSLYLGRYKAGGKEAIEAFKLKGITTRQPRLE